MLQRVGGREESEQDRALFPVADDGRADGRGDHQEVDADLALQEEIAQRGDRGEGAAGDVGENEERDRDRRRRGCEVLDDQRQPPGRASRRPRPRPGSSAPRSFPRRRRGGVVRLRRVHPAARSGSWIGVAVNVPALPVAPLPRPIAVARLDPSGAGRGSAAIPVPLPAVARLASHHSSISWGGARCGAGRLWEPGVVLSSDHRATLGQRGKSDPMSRILCIVRSLPDRRPMFSPP